MIPSNELRIGNYVARKNTSDGLWHEIRSISRDQLHPINTIEQDWEKNCFWSSDCKLEDLKPIYLTEEILLSFGFEWDGEKYELPGTDNKPKLKFEIYEGDEASEYRLYLPLRRYVSIQSVHQLQNLFYALTDKELTYQPVQP